MLIFLVFLFILNFFLVTPTLLLASARLFKIHEITFRRALSTYFLILIFILAFRIVVSLLSALFGVPRILFDILNSIVGILLAVWIIKKRFSTPILRSIGICLSFILFTVALALFIRTFAVQAYKIPSGGMEPTLLVGDHLFVNKFIYGIKMPFLRKTIIPIKEPRRDDVIAFIYPVDKSKEFIKRVIGIPGEKIEILGRDIYINERLFNDKHGFYVNQMKERKYHFGPIVVPDDHYFVLGDNRDHSYDSRFWGFVSREEIKGKAFIIYWSWPNQLRSERIGKPIK